MREQGARIAHNSPNKLGGPLEWLVTPLAAAAFPPNMVSLPGTGFWRMINEARSWGHSAFIPGPKRSNSLLLPLQRKSVDEERGLTRSTVPKLGRGI